MNKLIMKIRSWFCKHDWECLEERIPVIDTTSENASQIPHKYIWLYRCKKCGYVNKVELKG